MESVGTYVLLRIINNKNKFQSIYKNLLNCLEITSSFVIKTYNKWRGDFMVLKKNNYKWICAFTCLSTFVMPIFANEL